MTGIIYIFQSIWFQNTGAVKDSAVGEERLALYLLAILNIRKTPLHWNNLMNSTKQTDGSSPELVERISSIFGNSFQRRRKALDVTDIVYVEVRNKELSILKKNQSLKISL